MVHLKLIAISLAKDDKYHRRNPKAVNSKVAKETLKLRKTLVNGINAWLLSYTDSLSNMIVT